MDRPAARFRADLAHLCDLDRTRLLVAVSGGPDSLALLLLAHATLGERCSAATVDHGLRAESRAEADHVAAVCAARGIPHAILSGPLPGRAGRTANVSARARALRYRLLHEHAEAIGCDLIATAHHLDDQVETMAMRLNRGAGVSGMAGVRARNGEVVRPLLGWRRAELAAIVADAGLVVIEDPSNSDGRFDRARMRTALDRADWVDRAGWARSAAALGDVDTALHWVAEKIGTERCRVTPDACVFEVADTPVAIARRIVEDCLRRCQPDLDPRGEAITRLLVAPSPRSTVGNVLVTARGAPGAGLVLTFTPAPPRRTGV